ncbi:hypothetical protein COLO4_10834 [Corchorus olitorius]|uniref:Uncharacterized protein n=1 Tax=Corchorus olitorius TaxID=93759 RepID=A0A1R3K716_9ROSI|nr:hypothetical protein COLO4_10834 [Corchorus olitorius]
MNDSVSKSDTKAVPVVRIFSRMLQLEEFLDLGSGDSECSNGYKYKSMGQINGPTTLDLTTSKPDFMVTPSEFQSLIWVKYDAVAT